MFFNLDIFMMLSQCSDLRFELLFFHIHYKIITEYFFKSQLLSVNSNHYISASEKDEKSFWRTPLSYEKSMKIKWNYIINDC